MWCLIYFIVLKVILRIDYLNFKTLCILLYRHGQQFNFCAEKVLTPSSNKPGYIILRLKNLILSNTWNRNEKELRECIFFSNAKQCFKWILSIEKMYSNKDGVRQSCWLANGGYINVSNPNQQYWDTTFSAAVTSHSVIFTLLDVWEMLIGIKMIFRWLGPINIFKK